SSLAIRLSRAGAGSRPAAMPAGRRPPSASDSFCCRSKHERMRPAVTEHRALKRLLLAGTWAVVRAACCAVALGLIAPVAVAQKDAIGWPVKPVRVIV